MLKNPPGKLGGTGSRGLHALASFNRKGVFHKLLPVKRERIAAMYWVPLMGQIVCGALGVDTLSSEQLRGGKFRPIL